MSGETFERTMAIHEVQRTFFYLDRDKGWSFQIGGEPPIDAYGLRDDVEQFVLDHGRGVYRVEFRDQEFPTVEAMIEACILVKVNP